MKRSISLLLSAVTLVLFLTGCNSVQEDREGGTITIKNDTRGNVYGSYQMPNSYGSWNLAAGESWNKSFDVNGEYSVSFPSYQDNGQYHNGEEISGSLSGGREVTLYVSSYVPSLKPLADYVRFNNNNPVPVMVYSDSARQNKIADVKARGTSPYLTNLSYYNRDVETHLYITYHLFGAVAFPFDYDFINNVTIVTNVTILTDETPLPILDNLMADEKNKILTNDAYIIVTNTSSFSLILASGANEIPPLGSSSSVLGSGKTGAYRVNADGASSYQFKQNGISAVAFPSGLSAFSAGILYALKFSGSGLSWAFDNSSSSSMFAISVSGALRYQR